MIDICFSFMIMCLFFLIGGLDLVRGLLKASSSHQCYTLGKKTDFFSGGIT